MHPRSGAANGCAQGSFGVGVGPVELVVEEDATSRARNSLQSVSGEANGRASGREKDASKGLSLSHERAIRVRRDSNAACK